LARYLRPQIKSAVHPHSDSGGSTQQAGPADNPLRSLFGLTPAECRLVALLADGHSLSEIMELVGVSRNTVKSQLASIYGKTGTSRQAQLVRLLLQLPEMRKTAS
jgi:DNA-binding CsgD family transcriptional regulator